MKRTLITKIPGDPGKAPEPREVQAAAQDPFPGTGTLPDEADIDPAAIERPVLSMQGWVLPHKAS